VELALSSGFQPLSMGERVLRSETAALYAAVCYARGL
jgi:16S rRNA U1498 N3-methylase RsmE